jgi:drug/metabolite transporter (DMT)-like permease
MGLAGMVAYALSTLLLRRLGHRDGTATIAFWFLAMVCAGSAMLAWPHWRPLDPAHVPQILVIGIAGVFGQALLTAAFRRASAAVVAPFDYTHMIWALIYGQLFWGYAPDWPVWFGAAIIIASGLFILLRERRADGRLRRAVGVSPGEQ